MAVSEAPQGIASEPGTSLEVERVDLLSLALRHNAAIDVIERLAALKEKARIQEAEIQFNDALNRVQEQIKRIVPDLENPSKKNKYASYAAIDRVIRPIYAKEGFSLSFTHADCPKPEHIRVVCRVALGLHKEFYQIDMPVDTAGPQGKEIMTRTHATASADSYAKRYLVKDVFNISIGEDDSDGNCGAFQGLEEKLDWIASAKPLPELQRIFGDAYKEAKKLNDTVALKQLVAVYERRKRELGVDNANHQ